MGPSHLVLAIFVQACLETTHHHANTKHMDSVRGSPHLSHWQQHIHSLTSRGFIKTLLEGIETLAHL